jgi:hypothetical protein
MHVAASLLVCYIRLDSYVSFKCGSELSRVAATERMPFCDLLLLLSLYVSADTMPSFTCFKEHLH